MSIYAISDLHLSFCPWIDKPMDIYGPEWHDHAERIKRNWEDVVSDDDTVVLAGDISWGLKLEEAVYDLEWIDALPGRKVIFKGNHDLWWRGITKLNTMYDTITFMQNDCYRAEDIYICGTRGWLTPDSDDFTEDDEKIYRRELLRLRASLDRAVEECGGACGERILGVLHYPPVSRAAAFSGFQQIFEEYGVRNVIYGHLHGAEGFGKAIEGSYHGVEYRLVSADRLSCMPALVDVEGRHHECSGSDRKKEGRRETDA